LCGGAVQPGFKDPLTMVRKKLNHIEGPLFPEVIAITSNCLRISTIEQRQHATKDL